MTEPWHEHIEASSKHDPSSVPLLTVGYLCAFGSIFVFPPALGLVAVGCAVVLLLRDRTAVAAGVTLLLAGSICAAAGALLGILARVP